MIKTISIILIFKGFTTRGIKLAITVISAFKTFMKDFVNLTPERTSTARTSRDWLKKQINSFDDFFPLYEAKHIDFGSFSRKTKIKPLDDIDLIFAMSANGVTWSEYGNVVYLTVPETSDDYKNYTHDGSSDLNSKKIINQFVRSLKNVSSYDKADIHRNKNAATLKLLSYDWNFDIVPAFYTKADNYGRSFYLIPNGEGHWMKTDPTKDKERTTNVNQCNKGKVLEAIRAIKYWNKRPTMPSMGSYLLENMVLEYFDSNNASDYVDYNIANLLLHISTAVFSVVVDPKGIQGNLNTLSYEEQVKISNRALEDSNKAFAGIEFEKDTKMESAIKEWGKVFGSNFPSYG